MAALILVTTTFWNKGLGRPSDRTTRIRRPSEADPLLGEAFDGEVAPGVVGAVPLSPAWTDSAAAPWPSATGVSVSFPHPQAQKTTTSPNTDTTVFICLPHDLIANANTATGLTSQDDSCEIRRRTVYRVLFIFFRFRTQRWTPGDHKGYCTAASAVSNATLASMTSFCSGLADLSSVDRL